MIRRQGPAEATASLRSEVGKMSGRLEEERMRDTLSKTWEENFVECVSNSAQAR